MSMGALLRGVEARLRSTAVLNDQPTEAVGKLVGVMPDGSPPNSFGQFYCAVHSLGWRESDPNALSGDELYSVGVTVTARLNYAPGDRRGRQMTNPDDFLAAVGAVQTALHQDDLHRIEANKLIAGTAEYVAVNGGSATANGFLEPLRFQSASEVQPVPPGWGGIENTKDVYRVALRFIDARLVRPL